MRLKGWELALLDEVERHDKLPFSWEQSNCAYFVMDCVKAITGNDPWGHERGCTSEDYFRKGLKRYGFKDIGDAFAAKFKEIPVFYMGRGDIATWDHGDGRISGAVCVGSYLVSKATTGMTYIPIASAVRAFKVD